MTQTRNGFLFLFVLWMLGGIEPLVAQVAPALSLGLGDVTVEPRQDGYHLFIRQVPGAASVLLTEAFELPDHKLATYALRAVGPNPENDAEKRLLDGKFLPQPHHSLISSTPVKSALGPAFSIVVPRTVEYGSAVNPNSRYGKVDLTALLTSSDAKFWFSVRVFAKPYGDYTGGYRETAFELRAILQQVYVPSPDRYEQDLVDGFNRLGKGYPAQDIDDAIHHVGAVLDQRHGSLDMVLAIDTTKSMVGNLKTIQANVLGPIREAVKKFKSFRVGLVFYRDYMEEYLTRPIAFTSDLDQVQRDLDQAVADGGGDIPEAVVEALWVGLNNFHWQADNRVILLFGDSPQHPTPRGAITEAMVRQKADDEKVELQMVMLPETPF